MLLRRELDEGAGVQPENGDPEESAERGNSSYPKGVVSEIGYPSHGIN
jgi:hypothetical protein